MPTLHSLHVEKLASSANEAAGAAGSRLAVCEDVGAACVANGCSLDVYDLALAPDLLKDTARSMRFGARVGAEALLTALARTASDGCVLVYGTADGRCTFVRLRRAATSLLAHATYSALMPSGAAGGGVRALAPHPTRGALVAVACGGAALLLSGADALATTECECEGAATSVSTLAWCGADRLAAGDASGALTIWTVDGDGDGGWSARPAHRLAAPGDLSAASAASPLVSLRWLPRERVQNGRLVLYAKRSGEGILLGGRSDGSLASWAIDASAGAAPLAHLPAAPLAGAREVSVISEALQLPGGGGGGGRGDEEVNSLLGGGGGALSGGGSSEYVVVAAAGSEFALCLPFSLDAHPTDGGGAAAAPDWAALPTLKEMMDIGRVAVDCAQPRGVHRIASAECRATLLSTLLPTSADCDALIDAAILKYGEEAADARSAILGADDGAELVLMLSEKGLHFLAVAADAPQPPPAPAAAVKPAVKEKWAPASPSTWGSGPSPGSGHHKKAVASPATGHSEAAAARPLASLPRPAKSSNKALESAFDAAAPTAAADDTAAGDTTTVAAVDDGSAAARIIALERRAYEAERQLAALRSSFASFAADAREHNARLLGALQTLVDDESLAAIVRDTGGRRAAGPAFMTQPSGEQ